MAALKVFWKVLRRYRSCVLEQPQVRHIRRSLLEMHGNMVLQDRVDGRAHAGRFLFDLFRRGIQNRNARRKLRFRIYGRVD